MIQYWDVIIASNDSGTYGVATLFDNTKGTQYKAIVYQSRYEGLYVLPMIQAS